MPTPPPRSRWARPRSNGWRRWTATRRCWSTPAATSAGPPGSRSTPAELALAGGCRSGASRGAGAAKELRRMKDGKFVFDAHSGYWDASAENCKNRFGDAFIETFYAFHTGFNPPDPKWTMDYERQFRKVDPDWYLEEMFVKGSADMSILSTQVPMDFPLYEKCLELGVKNMFFHKGPAVEPLSLSKFDVRDIDEPAWLYPDLNFIIDHCGAPRVDDFCWIAARCPNVYAGLAVVLAFIHNRPRWFAEVMANLLFWLGPDRIVYGTDFPIWYPHWQLDDFMA